MKRMMQMPNHPSPENQTKQTYLPPTLIVYGKVGKLTRSGASGVSEAPSNSRHKRA
ncbi:MAG: hypothetical protein V2I51_18855 [Anderseniella sp.]|jgi:hypothetical protein|nr:hypothetical protein [Anderseniella sp.]